MRLQLVTSIIMLLTILVGSRFVRAQNSVCSSDNLTCIYLPSVLVSGTPPVVSPTGVSQTPTISGTTSTPVATFQPTRPSVTPSTTTTATTVPTTTPTSTSIPMANVVIISSNTFVPYTGSTSLYIVGEVRNEGTSIATSIQINAVLRNTDGKIVDGSYSYSAMSSLSNGMTSPFLIIFSNPPAWSLYELTVTASVTTQEPYELQFINPEVYFDSSDAYHVRGKVYNQDILVHSSVQVLLTMYDQNDQVVGMATGYTNPSTLNSNQEVPFDIYAYFWKYKPDRSKVVRYVIHSYD